MNMNMFIHHEVRTYKQTARLSDILQSLNKSKPKKEKKKNNKKKAD